MSPMFWAAYNDHVDIVIYLIKNGASVQRKTKVIYGKQLLLQHPKFYS